MPDQAPETLDEILRDYFQSVVNEAVEKGPEGGIVVFAERAKKQREQALSAITSLIETHVIGGDDDMTLKINPASDEDLLISLGENANNRLRAEQRKRLKELL